MSIGLSLFVSQAALCTGSPDPLPVPLKSFDATYRIRVGGINVGELTRELRIETNQKYSFRSVSKAAGLAALFSTNKTEEIATGKFTESAIRPNHYSRVRDKKGKKRRETVYFDYAKSQVNTTRKGVETVNEFSGLAFDPLSYQLQLMTDLNRNSEQLQYTVHAPKKTKRYSASRGAVEKIETPIGTFVAVEIQEQTNADKKTTFWCAVDLGFLPVRVLITDGDERTLIELAKHNYLPDE
ncbi:MAG: DUF3108 domain-containing protein [Pseudomonadota bacterium]